MLTHEVCYKCTSRLLKSLIKILFRWRLAGVQYDSGKLCMLAQSYSKTTNEWLTNNIGNNSYKCIIAISELKSWEGISPASLLFPRWLQRILEICWVDFDHIKKITYTEKNWQLKRVEDIQVLCVEQHIKTRGSATRYWDGSIKVIVS